MNNKIEELIINLINQGHSIKEIANLLHISSHTVKAYISRFKFKNNIEFLFKNKP